MAWTKIDEAYASQKHDAKRRGIAFLFSKPEWIAWWRQQLGPNWFQLRGQGKGKFCMCRKGDVGPYVAWNVECKLHEDNVKDNKRYGRNARGERHWCSLLTEQQVLVIHHSPKDSRILAKEFNISRSMIYSIKQGRKWSYLFNNSTSTP